MTKTRFGVCSVFAWAVLLAVTGCSREESLNLYQSYWREEVERTWVGPDLWANRLQDWRIAGGRLECLEGSTQWPMRTVHLLTRRLGRQKGSLKMSVITGPVGGPNQLVADARSGFLIGVGADIDYRAAALVHHSYGPGGGLFAGVDGAGKLFVRDFTQEDAELTHLPSGIGSFEALKLNLSVEPAGIGYTLTLSSHDSQTGRRKDRLTLREIDPDRLAGNVALVSHTGSPTDQDTGSRFWFENWSVSGSKLGVDEDRLCGPIVSTQYTLSRNILKMTAQMMPMGAMDAPTVRLEVGENGAWKQAATADIVVPGFTATFRVENWDSGKDTPYRVRYALKDSGSTPRTYEWAGTVRRDPTDQDSVSLAAFTGNQNLGDDGHRADHSGFPWAERVWFPHTDLTEQVLRQDPDVLFFSGDQVYEEAGPAVVQRAPSEKAELDYLYRWYLWCLAFRNLTRDRPAVTIPDAHDVYQRYLWGAGGRPTNTDNHGGYMMPPAWVNMVQRTQTSHLPDPFDPTPIEQGIEVYYTDMHYGRVSFAIIEDRKFKSGPPGLVPATRSGRADHVIDPDFDPAFADVPGATLLGARQHEFLETWAADWRDTDMKAVLSQSVFANATALHGPEQKRLVADYDSNGWPPTGRNEAIKKFRKAHAVHISGDHHLASLVHYGVDEWNDSGLSFGVPSIANSDPRASLPLDSGDFLDGFGNRLSVYAAANPGKPSGREPNALHDKMPAYGIVRFNKTKRTITFACWPRYADPETDGQYPGWPRTFTVEDNYGREPWGYLSTIELKGITDPVVQVFRGRFKELVYALRIRGSTFRPWVFEPGSYSVKIGEPGTDKMKTLLGMSPLPPGVKRTLVVELPL